LDPALQAGTDGAKARASAMPPARTAGRAVQLLVTVSGMASFALYFYGARRSFT